MATEEQIEKIKMLLEDCRPIDFFKRMNETTAGIGAVLRFLYESSDTVTAGKISSFMNVSTARVAVLLKKMAAKNLILKEAGTKDARTTVVRLSAHGLETVQQMRADLYRQLGLLIDRIGLERMTEYALMSKEIHAVIKNSLSDRIKRE